MLERRRFRQTGTRFLCQRQNTSSFGKEHLHFSGLQVDLDDTLSKFGVRDTVTGLERRAEFIRRDGLGHVDWYLRLVESSRNDRILLLPCRR